MKRQTMIHCAAALLTMALAGSSAHAQWGYYRVNSSYSLPSVPYAFNPVVVPAVQPTTTFSPVVVNQSFAQPIVAPQPTIVGQPVVVGRPVIVGQPVISQPIVSQPVVVGRPVVVGQPLAPSAVVVRRGVFRRPVVVTSAPGSVVVPASVPGTAASPVIVQRPIWIGP